MGWSWDAPPGIAAGRKGPLRKVLLSFLVGALSLGAAWAGVGLTPVRDLVDADKPEAKGRDFVGLEERNGEPEPDSPGTAAAPSESQSLEALEPGQIYAGAAKVSLFPRPEDYVDDFPNATWERDQEKCETFSPSQAGVQEAATHVANFRVRWPESPNCLYMGGYGLGPMNAIETWDDYGLWSRSVAMQDAQGDTIVLTLIDAVYWEAHYNSMCPKNPCGFIDLANQLAEETGLAPESFVFMSTHSHTAMDFIGGWGGVPDWYMQQAADSMKASVTQSLASLQPAVLEAGESIVRERSSERRDFYRSAEDDGLSWFRLIDADDQPTPEDCPGPIGSGAPPCKPGSPGRAIATVGAYAAHPVTEDESGGQADADFPAVFAKSVEDRFGGIGMFLQTGLGNVSPRGNKIEMGTGLASYVPAIGGGGQVTDTNVRVGRTFWEQPVTNVPLGGLGVTGFFDRTMNETPAAIQVGKAGSPNQKCNSASPISVRTSVSAARVGTLLITGGPGELFSNLTNTIEEKNPGGVTLALGLANDGLGYIIQNFETDHLGRQGTGFVGDPIAEYEDAYSIDHCIGDATLEYTLQLIGRI
jgi:hypothetical protein